MRPRTRSVWLVVAATVGIAALLWLLAGRELGTRTRNAPQRGGDPAPSSQSPVRALLSAAPAASAGEPAWDVGALVGRVVDAGGQPVANATIAIEHYVPGADSLPAGVDLTWEADWDLAQDFRRQHGAEIDARLAPVTSDQDGRFRWDALPVLGCLAIRIARDGFAPYELRGRCVFHGVTSDLGTLVLRPEAAIAGRVAPESGAPVAGARVRVQVANSRRQIDRTVVCADDGSFQCGSLIGGAACITVACADHVLWPPAVALTLGDGERREGLVLSMRRELPIAGMVRDPRRAPIAGARVRTRVAIDHDWISAPDVLSDDAGEFVVHGLAAPYRCSLSVSAPGYRPADLQVAAGTSGLVIELARQPAIEVITRDASTGAAVTPRELIVTRAGERAHGSASASDRAGWRERGPGRRLVPYGSAGTFTIEARASGYLAAESEPIAADGVADGGPIELKLLPAPRIEGVVRRASSGLPVPCARVELYQPLPPRTLASVRHQGVAVRDDRQLLKITRTDSLGEFCFALDGETCRPRFGDQPPSGNRSGARWSMRVIAPDLAPQLVEGVSPSAGRIVIELATGGSIAGTVTGLDGVPATGVVIVAALADGTCRSARSDADGRYAVGPLAAGRYRLSVGDPGLSEHTFFSCGLNVDVPEPDASLFGIAVEAARTTRCDLDLRRPLDGAAVAGCITVTPAREDLTISLLVDATSKDALARHDPASTQVGADGKYALFGVIAGHRTLVVTDRRGLPLASRDLDLVRGETTRADFTIELVPLRGTVADARNGRSLRAQVALSAGERPSVHAETTTTDADGAFTFADLGVGVRCGLEVWCEGYYPEQLKVAPGREAAELRIAMWPPGRLEVHVAAARERDALDLTLLQNGERVDAGWSRPSPDTFRFDAVRPGTYELVVVEAVGARERTARATVTIEWGQQTEVGVSLR
ncbi:MAG: carboxypeptidase-like regulatory domain-containing protein [Planctomycetota bacterium]